MIQKLPIAADERVETGVVQFGDDWPGIFLRGDAALPYSMYLRQLMDLTVAGHRPDAILQMYVRQLADLLESCRAVKEEAK